MAEDSGGDSLTSDRNTKKVCFKDLDPCTNNVMAVDSTPVPKMSWRDKMLGRGAFGSSYDEDFEFIEGDVVRSTVNGISAISFSKRV